MILKELINLCTCYVASDKHSKKWILVSFKKPYTCTVVKISLISNYCLFFGLVLLQSNWQLLGRHKFNREYNKSSWCHSLFRCVRLAGCILLLHCILAVLYYWVLFYCENHRCGSILDAHFTPCNKKTAIYLKG